MCMCKNNIESDWGSDKTLISHKTGKIYDLRKCSKCRWFEIWEIKPNNSHDDWEDIELFDKGFYGDTDIGFKLPNDLEIA